MPLYPAEWARELMRLGWDIRKFRLWSHEVGSRISHNVLRSQEIWMIYSESWTAILQELLVELLGWSKSSQCLNSFPLRFALWSREICQWFPWLGERSQEILKHSCQIWTQMLWGWSLNSNWVSQCTHNVWRSLERYRLRSCETWLGSVWLVRIFQEIRSMLQRFGQESWVLWPWSSKKMCEISQDLDQLSRDLEWDTVRLAPASRWLDPRSAGFGWVLERFRFKSWEICPKTLWVDTNSEETWFVLLRFPLRSSEFSPWFSLFGPDVSQNLETSPEIWIYSSRDKPWDFTDWAWDLRHLDEFSQDLDWGHLKFDPVYHRMASDARSFVWVPWNFGLRSLEIGP